MSIAMKPRAVAEHVRTVADLSPRLSVIGIGGAGCNAINNMIDSGLEGVDFIAANTDAQSLAMSRTEQRVQLGVNLTEGLGAGSKPEIGEAAAEEAADDIRARIANAHMVFIAAGMGGGTGTGAASVIARLSRELGSLTVGVVTTPFLFEGTRRMRVAEAGIEELKKYVDTLIVIPNQNLFRIAHEKTTFKEAFVLADLVLYSGVACIVDLIVKKGLINLDFADVRTVMSGMGTAVMGTGEGTGERRAIMAAEEAISNPLLDDVSLKGAKGLLLSITGGPEMTLHEVDEAASRIRQEVDAEANIIVGATFDETLGERVRVSIVASGMSRSDEPSEDAGDLRKRARRAAPVSAIPGSQDAASAGGSGDTGEIHRRLSAAISYDHMADAHSGAPTPPHPSRREKRGVWHGPGNVAIEERLPDLISDDLVEDAFTPPHQAVAHRAARRMPDVEDFPAVGQREYRAKAANAAEYESPGSRDEARAPVRRPGLFEMLTGRARN